MEILLWIIVITLFAAVGAGLFGLLILVIPHPWVEAATAFFVIVLALGIFSFVGYGAYLLLVFLLAR